MFFSSIVKLKKTEISECESECECEGGEDRREVRQGTGTQR